MQLRQATLIKGTIKPVGFGVTAPERALVRLDGNSVAAILKRLDTGAIAAECFAALVLIEWGIPVPEPILVQDDEQILFGSLEMAYPNLRQRMGLLTSLPPQQLQALQIAACKVVTSFPQTPAALAADEAIANFDRNFENILWDGTDPSFIDHEKAFGVHSPDANKLAQMSILAGEHIRVQQSSIAYAFTLAKDTLQKAAHTLITKGIDATDFRVYVETRLPKIGNKIIDRFPKPQDLLQSSPT